MTDQGRKLHGEITRSTGWGEKTPNTPEGLLLTLGVQREQREIPFPKAREKQQP